jgi:hypothetical protein
VAKPGYNDVTCSAGSSTSTGELHERISAPHGRLAIAFDELALAI